MSEEMKVKKYTPSTFAGTKFPPEVRRQIKQRIHKTPIIRAVEHHEQVIKPKIQEIERMIKYKSPKEAAMLGFRYPKEAVKSDNVSLVTRIGKSLSKFVNNIAKNPFKLLKIVK